MCNQVQGFHCGVVLILICVCIHTYFQAKLNSKSSDFTIHMSDPNSKSSNILSGLNNEYYKSRIMSISFMMERSEEYELVTKMSIKELYSNDNSRLSRFPPQDFYGKE